MDKTPLFKACVKAIKIRSKGVSPSKSLAPTDKLIVPTTTTETTYDSMHAAKAKELTESITQLRDFLVTHRRDYINSCNALSGASLLSESERDEIDTQTESAIRNARSLLKALDAVAKQSATTKRESTRAQHREHQTGVHSIIDAYLAAVCRMHAEQRAIRVAKANDMKRLSRLSALLKTTTYRRHRPNVDADGTENAPIVDTPIDVPGTTVLRKRRTPANTNEDKTEHARPPQHHEEADDRVDVVMPDVTPAEQTQLTAENEQMFDRFNTMVDEIDQLANDVEEISRLQGVFTEHVLTQETTIDTVHATTIHATEDVKYGNEQLKEAMKRKADLRVWVLFALLVLTFTLLFLDWYNP